MDSPLQVREVVSIVFNLYQDINKFFAANEKVMLRAIIRFEKKMGKYITEIPD